MHTFDRFYVVTKFILPSIVDLKFSNLNNDNTCTFMDKKNANKHRNKKIHVRSKNLLQTDRLICNLL